MTTNTERAFAELDKLHAELEMQTGNRKHEPWFDDLFNRIGTIIAVAKGEVTPEPEAKPVHNYIVTVQIFASGGEQIHVQAESEAAADAKAIKIAEKMFADGVAVLDLQEVTISERWRA